MSRELRTASLNADDVIKIATRIVEHLTESPGDFAGAGQLVGLSRDKVLSLLDRFPELFADIEEQYFDKLNSLCRMAALGKELPEGHERFNFNMARTLLTWRQKEVAAAKKQIKVEKKENTIDITRLEASKLISEHLAKVNSIHTKEIKNGETEEDNTPNGDTRGNPDLEGGDFDLPTTGDTETDEPV